MLLQTVRHNGTQPPSELSSKRRSKFLEHYNKSQNITVDCALSSVVIMLVL